jgi:predicted metalloprotease with PDZ domain
MQLRGGLISLESYLKEQSQKVFYDRNFYNTSCSLSKLSLTCFTAEGQKQYGNIYQRGALVSALLDIRLLELSGGKRGLREVVLELAKKYGPSKPFVEKTFMDEFAQMTFPEIRDFFESYVKNANTLPIKEYFEKIGITYWDAKPTGRDIPDVGVRSASRNGKLVVTDYRASLESAGLRENDELVALNGQKITSQTQLSGIVSKLSTTTTASLTVAREGREIALTIPVASRKEEKPFVFEVNVNAYKKQIALRELWLKNAK